MKQTKPKTKRESAASVWGRFRRAMREHGGGLEYRHAAGSWIATLGCHGDYYWRQGMLAAMRAALKELEKT